MKAEKQDKAKREVGKKETKRRPGSERVGPVRRILFLLCAVLVGVLDQATKEGVSGALENLPGDRALRVVEGVLYLKPTHNSGGLFGLFDTLPPRFFMFVTALFVVYLAWLILMLPFRQARYLSPLSLLLGGFLGNGVDRFVHGFVVDFIYVTGYPSWLPSTFNLADVAIGLALIWLVGAFAAGLFIRTPEEKEKSGG